MRKAIESNREVLIKWQTVIVSGLSYIHFVEQLLTDPELALICDGWVAWGIANAPEGLPDGDVSQLLNAAFTTYNGRQSEANRVLSNQRVARVMRDREMYSGDYEKDTDVDK